MPHTDTSTRPALWKRFSILLALLAFVAAPTLAQTAQVQVIHNSPYAEAALVDVYINDGLALDDVAFRDATGFLELDAGVALTIDVTAADAADNGSPVYSETLTLDADGVYVLVAAGDPLDRMGNPAFDLVPGAAQTAADLAGNVEFQVFHGAPDAPTVDVAARGAGVLVDDLAYGAFSPAYVSVAPAVYDIDVETADNSAVAASAVADLSGAADAALTVLASGFLAPEEGQPGFELLAVFADGSTALLPANTADVQIIHNAPVGTVDVYVNDALTLDDFAFRTATPYVALPAGTTAETAPELKIDLTAADAPDNGSPVYTQTVSLLYGTTYALTAVGDGSQQPLALVPYAGAQTAGMGGQVALLAQHGAPDAPTVDVVARTVGPLVDDLAFGAYADGYVNVPPAAYVLDVTPADDNDTVVASFVADLSGLTDAALTVIASGYLAPGEGQPAFGLFAFTAEGGAPVVLPQVVSIQAARDAAGDAEGLATEGIVTRAEGRQVRIQDDTAAIGTFASSGAFRDAVDAGEIAAGDRLVVVGDRGDFNNLTQLNPTAFVVTSRGNDLPMPQTVTLAEIAANGEQYEAELIRVEALMIERDGDVVFDDNTTYQISDPSDETGAVTLRVPNAADTRIEGEPIPPGLVVFEGVLGQFSSSDPGAGYQLAPVAAEDVFKVTARVQVIHNSADPGAAEVDIYLANADGPIAKLEDVAFRTATAYLDVPAGGIDVTIAPPTSESEEDGIFEKQLNVIAGGTYVVTAAGLLGEGAGDAAFDLFADAGRELADEAGTTDVAVFHGVTDAPTVDAVVPAETPVVLADDVSFGQYGGYVRVPTADYPVNVETADNSAVVASYTAPLATLGLEGTALVVVASGYLTPPEGVDDRAFGLYAVTPDGSVVPLPVTSDVAAESPAEVPDAFALEGNYPNPFNPTTTLRFDLPQAAQVQVALYDVLGRQVLALPPQAVAAGAARTLQVDASALPSGVYLYRLVAEMEAQTSVATGQMVLLK